MGFWTKQDLSLFELWTLKTTKIKFIAKQQHLRVWFGLYWTGGDCQVLSSVLQSMHTKKPWAPSPQMSRLWNRVWTERRSLCQNMRLDAFINVLDPWTLVTVVCHFYLDHSFRQAFLPNKAINYADYRHWCFLHLFMYAIGSGEVYGGWSSIVGATVWGTMVFFTSYIRLL